MYMCHALLKDYVKVSRASKNILVCQQSLAEYFPGKALTVQKETNPILNPTLINFHLKNLLVVVKTTGLLCGINL